MDTAISKPRDLAALFMLLLVAWNTAEFALQPVRRPASDEILILIFTFGVLIFLPYVRAGSRRVLLGALIGTGAHWLFAVAGLYLAAANEGFGKYGPAVAAVLLTVAVWAVWRARQER
jgi:hypothetical protein